MCCGLPVTCFITLHCTRNKDNKKKFKTFGIITTSYKLYEFHSMEIFSTTSVWCEAKSSQCTMSLFQSYHSSLQLSSSRVMLIVARLVTISVSISAPAVLVFVTHPVRMMTAGWGPVIMLIVVIVFGPAPVISVSSLLISVLMLSKDNHSLMKELHN